MNQNLLEGLREIREVCRRRGICIIPRLGFNDHVEVHFELLVTEDYPIETFGEFNSYSVLPGDEDGAE